MVLQCSRRRIRAAVLVAFAACGGTGASVSEPAAPPVVRVVRCAPATPTPLISAVGLDVEPLGSARELARFRLRGHAAREAIAPAKAVDVESIVIVSGSLDRNDVMAALRTLMPSFERCLTDHKAEQSTPTTLTASFVIEPDGSLTLVSTTGPAAMGLRSCVNDALRAKRVASSGGSSRVSVRLVFEPGALGAPHAEAPPAEPPEPWTPYAVELAEQLDSAPQIARSLEAALTRRTGALDECFAKSPATGSVRAMLEIDAHGRVEASRVGGLGDRAVETCLHDALAGVAVATPTADTAEIACDLSRGDAAPWRVTPGAGYEEIDVSATQVSYGDLVLAPEGDAEPLRDGVTYLVVVDPDASGKLVDRALTWAHEGDGTLIAVRAPSGPPVLLGAGRSVYNVVGDGQPDARTSTVAVDGHTVTTCERMPMARGIATMSNNAAVSDPRAISGLLGDLATRCHESACTGTLGVAIAKATSVRDVVEIVAAARVHGFDRVLLGSGDCAPPHRDTVDD